MERTPTGTPVGVDDPYDHAGRCDHLEAHHLSYGGRGGDGSGDGDEPSHEITVALCRWCHTKVHKSFARIDDDAAPDVEAIAEREGRRTKELDELGFQTARDRAGDE